MFYKRLISKKVHFKYRFNRIGKDCTINKYHYFLGRWWWNFRKASYS